jgi:putative salt-induced outer membrane protein YdiY
MTALLMWAGAAARADEAAKENKGPWTINAGVNGIVNTGNSENLTVGGNKLIGWKVERNQVQWKTIGAFGRAEVAGVTETNTNNLKTELRYDRFLNDPMALFVLGHIGYDEPAGFDLRGGLALGFAHQLVVLPPHGFRYEVGPDYTHEERTDGTSDEVFSGRLFLEYVYTIAEWAKFSEGLETLTNVQDGEDTRFNSLTALTIKLTDIVSFQTGFNVRVDLQPVPGFEEVDTTTTIGLLFDIV